MAEVYFVFVYFVYFVFVYFVFALTPLSGRSVTFGKSTAFDVYLKTDTVVTSMSVRGPMVKGIRLIEFTLDKI